MSRLIYLDNHATTAVDPRVLDAMMPTLTELYGNAASREHAFGWQAEELVAQARERVAASIGATPHEIIFTSGATESVNLALFGVAEAYRPKGRHIITVETEHKAVLDCCDVLEERGFAVTRLPVAADGRVDVDELRDAITTDTILISVMLANNEIGTVQPLDAIGAVARESGVILMSDAAQAVGKLPIDLHRTPIDLLTVSGHKIYGPKGVGALYVRRRGPRVALAPLLFGGGHERGLRSGTLNVPGIVGLGAACAIADAEMAEESVRIAGLRDQLQERLTSLGGIRVNGPIADRLAGNLNISVEDIQGAELVTRLRGIAVSSGAACASADPEPSHVLRAIGVDDGLARSTLRFGLGRFNTAEEVEMAADHVIETVRGLRQRVSVPHAG